MCYAKLLKYMEGKGVIGLCIQTLIWICILYIKYDKYEIYDFPDSFLIVILAIGLFIYFYELMWNSSINSILSKRLNKVNTKLDLIRLLIESKPNFEVNSRGFHYNYEKIIVSFERLLYFEFDEVKDYSNIKFMNTYSEEAVIENKIMVIDINLLVRFMDVGCQDELESFVQKIKNEDSFRDRYYDCKTKFAFQRFDEKENVFVFENQSFWFASKAWMIIFYALLVGEFYKIYFESLLHRCSIDLVKQISRPRPNARIGRMLNEKWQFPERSDLNDLPSSRRQISNTSKSFSIASNTNNRLTSNYIAEGVPIIDNYDPLFDIQPMATPNYQSNSDNPLINDRIIEFTKIDEPQIFGPKSSRRPDSKAQKLTNPNNSSIMLNIPFQAKSDGNTSLASLSQQPKQIYSTQPNKLSHQPSQDIRDMIEEEHKSVSNLNNQRLLTNIQNSSNIVNVEMIKPIEKSENKTATPKLMQNYRYEKSEGLPSKLGFHMTPPKYEGKQDKASSTEVSSTNTPTRPIKAYEKKITPKHSPSVPVIDNQSLKANNIFELSKTYSNSKVFNTSLGDSRISIRYEEDSNSDKDYSQDIRQDIFDLFDTSEQESKTKKIKKVKKIQKK